MLLLDFASFMPQNSSAALKHLAPWPCACAVLAASALLFPAVAAAQQSTPPLLDAMTRELHRAFTSLGKQTSGNAGLDKQLPPYFLSYSVSDASFVSIRLK